MNHVVQLRLVSIQAQPNPQAQGGADQTPMQPGDRVMLVLTGPLTLQWPVTYADARDGMVEIGDIYELTLRKVPNFGARIGEAAVVGGGVDE